MARVVLLLFHNIAWMLLAFCYSDVLQCCGKVRARLLPNPYFLCAWSIQYIVLHPINTTLRHFLNTLLDEQWSITGHKLLATLIVCTNVHVAPEYYVHKEWFTVYCLNVLYIRCSTYAQKINTLYSARLLTNSCA